MSWKLTFNMCSVLLILSHQLSATIIPSGDFSLDPLLIGVNGNNGSVTVDGGSIISSGFDGVIGEGLGGNGQALITGNGTQVNIGNSPGSALRIGSNQATGVVDVQDNAQLNVRAFVGAGFSSGRVAIGNSGNGLLKIASGASLLVEDSVNTDESNKFGFDPTTNTAIGAEGIAVGFAGSSGNGAGQLTVDGAGSKVTVSGNAAFINVGESATFFSDQVNTANGQLDILNGASVEVNGNDLTGSLGIGKGTGNGVLNIDGAGSTLTVLGDGGAALWLGDDSFANSGGGSATMFASNSAFIDVTNGSGLGVFSVGSRFVDAEAYFSTGASLSSDLIWVSIGEGGTSGKLKVSSGASVQANSIIVGSDGLLTGSGTVIGNVQLINGGMINPGNTPGTLTIDGDLDAKDGELIFEIASLTDYDRIVMTGLANLMSANIQLLFTDGFLPTTLDSFDLISASDLVGLDQANFSVAGLAPDFLFDVAFSNGVLSLTALSNGRPINEPPIIWLLFAVGVVYASLRLSEKKNTQLCLAYRLQNIFQQSSVFRIAV